jgi:hypothetical protein
MTRCASARVRASKSDALDNATRRGGIRNAKAKSEERYAAKEGKAMTSLKTGDSRRQSVYSPCRCDASRPCAPCPSSSLAFSTFSEHQQQRDEEQTPQPVSTLFTSQQDQPKARVSVLWFPTVPSSTFCRRASAAARSSASFSGVSSAFLAARAADSASRRCAMAGLPAGAVARKGEDPRQDRQGTNRTHKRANTNEHRAGKHGDN